MIKTKILALITTCAAGLKVKGFWDDVQDDLDSWKANIENFSLDDPVAAWID